MKNLQEEKKYNPWFYRFLALVLFFLIVFMTRGLWGAYNKNNIAKDKLREAEVKLEELKKEQGNLLSSVNSLKTNRGVEAEIRQNFLVAKEGERLITIVENTNNLQKSTSTQAVPAWWQFWKWL